MFTVSCRTFNKINTASDSYNKILHCTIFCKLIINSRLYLQQVLSPGYTSTWNTWNSVPDTVHLLPLLFVIHCWNALWQIATHWKTLIVSVNMRQSEENFALRDMYCSYNIGQRRKWLHLAVYFCSQFVSFYMPEWSFVFRDIRDWERSSSLDGGRLWFHGRTTACLLTPESSHVMKGNST